MINAIFIMMSIVARERACENVMSVLVSVRARTCRPQCIKNEHAFCNACCCRDGMAPIHSAASGGSVACIEFLITRGADVHARDKFVLLPPPLLFVLVACVSGF